MTQRIVPWIRFGNQAREAVNLYVSVFNDAEVLNDSGSGSADTQGTGPGMISFRLAGLEFRATNSGSDSAFTPAISFFVTSDDEQEVDQIWEKLVDGGAALMELDRYPFSPKFGWLVDRYGVSWQLNLSGVPQQIAPHLMFVGNMAGRAEEAIEFYTSRFPDSSVLSIDRYGPNGPDTEGTISHAEFLLANQLFMALDSGLDHEFTFSPAISFLVRNERPEDADALKERLAAGGSDTASGSVTDKFGVTWQIGGPAHSPSEIA